MGTLEWTSGRDRSTGSEIAVSGFNFACGAEGEGSTQVCHRSLILVNIGLLILNYWVGNRTQPHCFSGRAAQDCISSR